ncbi:MAG: PQQ-binding-like beta-propeller repeat protein, partial [bacterium]
SPAIASDGTLYVGSFDKKIYALNPDRSLKWDYQAGDSIPSSPAIDMDGTIYFVDYDGKIYAFNPDGSLKWDYQTYDRIYSAVSIGSDGTVYAGSHDSRLYALNPDGSLKWRSQIGDEVISSPAIGPDGTIYIGNGTIIDNNESVEFGNGKVNAFNSYGTLKWSYQTGSFVSAPPAIDAEGTIYIGDWDGMVYALTPGGSLKWNYQTGGAIFSSPAIGEDGMIYVRCSDGNIYALGDTEPPEIICPANMLVPAINSIHVKVTYQATVTDNIDPSPVVVYKPRSGYDFLLGTTEVKATATDFSGNVSTCTFKVTVKDLMPPEVICPADLVVPDTGDLTEVSYSATVTDNLDRSPNVTYSPKSGSEFPVGTTEVLVKAKDYSGNSATCTFNVTVKDNPPHINCPVELIFPSTGDLTQVNYSVAVTDTIDPNPLIIYDPEPGSGFPPGTTLIRVVATDLSGNSSTCDFNLIVRDMPLEPGKLSDSSWPCMGHDSRHTGRSPYLGAQSNNLKWSYKTMNSIRCSPAIGADGTIYIGSWDARLYALNPDGSLKWSYKTGQLVSSSPAIGSDGTIYFGSEDHNIYALNPDGSLKWSYQSNKYVYSSPVIDADGTIYIGSHDGSIYALNQDGSLKWSCPIGSYVLSSPAIGADGMVYVGGSSDNKVYALDPDDGSLLLSFQTGDMVKSSPAIGDDGAVYIGSYDGKVYALNPNFTLRWSFQTGDKIISSPAIAEDGTIYIGSYDGRVYAINSNGSLKWSYKTSDSVTATAAIGSDGTVYIGGMDKNIYAFNPDGTIKWSYLAGQNIHLASPAIGKDGTIYIGCMDCKVYAFDGNGANCFFDSDNDGYGDLEKVFNSASCPEDYVADHTDCDDQDDSIYPGALELCDGKDNDCDGVIPNDEVDSDEDGHLACNDCNDNDGNVYPGASGTHNGKDNNCNGIIDRDEKKAYSPGSSYTTYLPLMLSPWLRQFQSVPMNYQQKVLTPSLPSMDFNIYQQFPWNIGYQTPYYQNIFSRNIYQYKQYQYNQPRSLFNQPYWSWPYFQSLNTFDNQFFLFTF